MEITVENAKFANQILGTDIYPFEILRIISPTELEIREIYASSYGQNMSEQIKGIISSKNRLSRENLKNLD